MPSFSALSVSVTMFHAAVTRKPAAQRIAPRSAQTPASWWVNITTCRPLSGMWRVIAPIGGHHVAAELLVLALDREIAMRVPGPLVEWRRRVLAQPSDEEFGDLVVVDRVGVGRIGDEHIVHVIVIRLGGHVADLARQLSTRHLRIKVQADLQSRRGRYGLADNYKNVLNA